MGNGETNTKISTTSILFFCILSFISHCQQLTCVSFRLTPNRLQADVCSVALCLVLNWFGLCTALTAHTQQTVRVMCTMCCMLYEHLWGGKGERVMQDTYIAYIFIYLFISDSIWSLGKTKPTIDYSRVAASAWSIGLLTQVFERETRLRLKFQQYQVCRKC